MADEVTLSRDGNERRTFGTAISGADGTRFFKDKVLTRLSVSDADTGETLTFATYGIRGVSEVAFRNISGTVGTPTYTPLAVTFTGASNLVCTVYVWHRR